MTDPEANACICCGREMPYRRRDFVCNECRAPRKTLYELWTAVNRARYDPENAGIAEVRRYDDARTALVVQLQEADAERAALEAERYVQSGYDPFARYRDTMNDGAVEFCGDCGAPCVVVRPGKTQCESCDWWEFAPESPFVRAQSGGVGPQPEEVMPPESARPTSNVSGAPPPAAHSTARRCKVCGALGHLDHSCLNYLGGRL